MRKVKQNLIKGLVFFTVYSIVYILIQYFIFEEEFDRSLIIAAVVGAILAWFLIPLFEKILNRIKKKKSAD